MTKEDLVRRVALYRELILKGVILSWDPSSGSRQGKKGSLPGFAIFQKGKLTQSGEIPLNIKDELQWKLQEQHRSFNTLLDEFHPNVLVFEDISPMRYLGRGKKVPQPALLKSVGALLSWPGPTAYIPLPPLLWKALVSNDYEKGDEADAIEMGQIVIKLAKRGQK